MALPPQVKKESCLSYWKLGSHIHGIGKGSIGVNRWLTCNKMPLWTRERLQGARKAPSCCLLCTNPPKATAWNQTKGKLYGCWGVYFSNGRPEAVVPWHIKSPNAEKSSPIVYLIKSTKLTSQTSYLETWKVLGRVCKGEPLLHVEFHLSCLVSW